MALAAAARINSLVGGGALSVPVSAKGTFATAILNSRSTAQTGAELLAPMSVTSSNIVPVKIGPGVSRFEVRGRYPIEASGGTHAGVVRLYAIYDEPTGGAWPNDGTVNFRRLDANNNSAGLTLAVDRTNNVRDAAYFYTAPASYTSPIDGTTSTLIDAMGGWYLLPLLETAADHATLDGSSVQVFAFN